MPFDTDLDLTRFLLLIRSEIGYSTHAVGKWHLGYCNDSYVPHNRGFDSFLGHYRGGVDYFTHSNEAPGTYLNHFLNGEPHIPEGGFDYATYAWSNRTNKILRESLGQPNFVYLAFNAPHEQVAAPQNLVDEMNALYPDMPATRQVHLAAVKSIDIAMQSVIEEASKLDRETIIIFHSDNGGSIQAYGGDAEGPRACNFPYKGYKSVLTEGGTLSPTWVYSTKREFHSRYIDGMIHIMDFFPTILHWAGFDKQMPRNLDGIDQYDLFENASVTKIRDRFIYGLLHNWDNNNLQWKTSYAVRYGDYKFMNYQTELIGNTQCPEGWSNNRHEKYLFPYKKKRTTMMNKVWEISDAEPNKETGEIKPDPGFSLYNLKNDPFETRNLGTGEDSKKYKKIYMDLMNDIQSYVVEEIQKGVEYPVTGKMNGNLLSKIFKKIPVDERSEHYFETGRIIPFDSATQESTGLDGYLGTNWCLNNLDDALLTQMYHDAVLNDQERLADMINLYLWDGYGPE
ncbi:Oidioi.mRNA.OKI2018_I69.PAR.g9577.t1.cds [Oikopleura dioica]|uniref:Oidioi.mRNA.OKI2018_I69.PAR.g9577.t1.cds n=1 Tax=Oikopleura dioica TaxID=34765 RepID=A0ABN7RQG3_OIKDI|nr:Oidioi.mRNA.OKI2018_I69.PAR.g9577.t1.cds [Oikopleura dioica]